MLRRARELFVRLNLSDKAKIMHQILDSITKRRGYVLRLRKMVTILLFLASDIYLSRWQSQDDFFLNSKLQRTGSGPTRVSD